MNGNVELGEFEFNPVEEQDFRLSVEGASKTGKSNTLAVILEDLADVNIPTLIIERLGIISPVRKEDERMVVVGARPEKGIDLAIPMDQLDQVVDLMFERSLKVILDISTYEDEGEGHTEHKAAAKVLKELNRRGRENLRSGNRIKCLAVIDEVHMLAPETNAPIDVDDYVKQCKSQIVKIFTEGGNKGINVITAYQRRSYTSKGVVSQADNSVIHRLHATDRGDAAGEIGVDEEEIKNLGTGEILAYGDLTKQRVVGPTKVRKRNSPDPREANFDLPEPSEEISEALSDLQEEIEVEKKQREERQNRIEELEEKLEEKEKKLEEIESDRELQERMAEAMENLSEGGDVSEELKKDVQELEEIKEEKRSLEQELEEKDSKISELQEKTSEKESEIDSLEAELSERKEMDMVKEELESNARSILRNIGASDPEVDEAREQIKELREEKKKLEERVSELKNREPVSQEETSPETIEEYKEFLDHPEVQDAIEEAKDECDSPSWVSKTIAAIIREGGSIDYEDIQDALGHSTKGHVNKPVNALQAHGLITKEKKHGVTHVDLNVDGIQEIRKKARKREETENLIEDLGL